MKEEFTVDRTDALIIGDVQIDFLPGGALPVPEGDIVIPVLNDYIDLFKRKARVYATKDWHPANHVSFKAFGGPWPPHCIQGSEGAKIHPSLKLPENVTIVSKATDPARESYSSFDGTGLAIDLKQNGITRVFVGGLATDYCVKFTILDALENGLDAVLLTDAIKGINVQPKDSEEAVAMMISSGAKTATLDDFPEPMDVPSGEAPAEEMEEKPLEKADKKKKARLRSRGPYRKARVEH